MAGGFAAWDGVKSKFFVFFLAFFLIFIYFLFLFFLVIYAFQIVFFLSNFPMLPIPSTTPQQHLQI